MDNQTLEMAATQPGFLGYERVNNQNSSIFISYWENRAAIDAWKNHSAHKMAKSEASRWYNRYLSQICRVESSHLFEK